MAWLDKIYLNIQDWKDLIKYMQNNRKKIYRKTNIKYPFNKCYWICWDKQDWIIFNCWSNLDLFLYRFSWIEEVKNQLENKYSKSFLSSTKIQKEKGFWWNRKYYKNIEIKNILKK